jgi:hypothetical protein
MQYNQVEDIYRYPVNGWRPALRNENGELINKSNRDSFILELISKNMYYPKSELEEKDEIISSRDAELVDLYSGIANSLKTQNVAGTNFFMNEFAQKFADAEKHTDFDFLKAQYWEMVAHKDSAKYYYNRFLKFSESKFSRRFRGYALSDTSSACFMEERNYAAKFIDNQPAQSTSNCYNILKPKYYYQSFSPGFVINREDYGPKTRYFPGINFGYDTKSTFYGIGISRIWSENFLLHVATSISDFQNDVLISAPYQLYKSTNCRLGIKLSPIVYYRHVNKGETNMPLKADYVNGGFGLSTSYHINAKLYMGISYQYFYYNQYNHLILNSTVNDAAQEVYQENILDVSIYYQLIKGISLKIGTMNQYPSLGLNIDDTFIGYNFKDKAFTVDFIAY